MRTYIDTSGPRKRSVIMFDSLNELIEHNTQKDHRSDGMNDPKWYGAANMREADKLAREGLPRLGIETIKLAQDQLSTMQGDIIRNIFNDIHDTSGAIVDMGRYVEGTPECMVNYFPVEELGKSPIISLIMNVSYNAGISPEAITKNGQSMMALVEAVQSTGKQVEVWTDQNVSGTSCCSARVGVRLKKAGEPFDVGALMYALTHPSYLRAHIFNAMHTHPEVFKQEVGIRNMGRYGSPITNARDMDDYPPYSVYIPVISSDRQAGQFVPMVLKQLHLTAA